MNEHDKTEIAYKNGFNDGLQAFAEKLQEKSFYLAEVLIKMVDEVMKDFKKESK